MPQKLYFTVGPSELYPTLPAHIQEALDKKIGTISHRGKAFQDIFKNCVYQLRTLMNIPDTHHIFFLSSATEIWERILQNCVDQKSLHLVNGSFSKRFYEFAVELGKTPEKIQTDFGKGFFAKDIAIPNTCEAICVTQNETSSGVCMPLNEIYLLKQKAPNALLFVDSVSSVPYPDYDYKIVDSVFFSVQKCFGLPAGLGVWIVNEKCIEKANLLLAQKKSIGTYHSLPSLFGKAKDFQTPETPNVWNIFLLGKVAEDMNNKGIQQLRKETDTKAAMLYEYFNSSKNFSIAVSEPVHRSATTIVANTAINASEVNKKLEPYNMVVGSGYSSYKETQIRIANFPALSIEQTEKLIEALKKELQ
ncbi:MAG: aminotransferase class V-fold PLP-dependent enzyme [Cytophagaceae bacterium]|nr:aminotransferase class V-fold PLP-dependent enzyme [Cytophagaceae bacterium]MDW8455629.1 aminotransferase class V-fold PLP-dependent enzyme [Cytophagaceae bacterium]